MGKVVAVSRYATHRLGKDLVDHIMLHAGLGVEGDAHRGETVKHRSRVAKDPTRPNLRQVHLIHTELFEELAAKGFAISPGMMGENIATRGVDLLGLPAKTRLRIGEATIELTGLRNPCSQLETMMPGLMKACLDHAPDGTLIRKAGVMGIVVTGGVIRPNDGIVIELPNLPYVALMPV